MVRASICGGSIGGACRIGNPDAPQIDRKTGSRSGMAGGLSSVERRLAMDRMMQAQGGRCFYCWKRMRRDVRSRHPDRATIEHRVPIKAGGTNRPHNIVAACRACNTAKGERSEAEFRAQIRLPPVPPIFPLCVKVSDQLGAFWSERPSCPAPGSSYMRDISLRCEAPCHNAYCLPCIGVRPSGRGG